MSIDAQIDGVNRKITLTASTEEEYNILFSAVIDLSTIIEERVNEETKIPERFTE